MKLIKVLSFILCACLFIGALSACTNNLADQWEDYTGNTDVYYTPTTTAPTTASTEKGEELDKYEIPRYWDDELESAVTETLKVVNDSKGNNTAFIWYNDAHWAYGAQRSTAILKFLQDYTGVNYVNFGGDIVSNYSEIEHSEIVSGLEEWREATLALSNHHSVVGNHDDDIAELANRNDLYDFLLKDEAGKTTDTNNKFCYYVDNEAEKTRYIYLSTGFDQTTSSDIRFLVNTLNSTQKDWHIVMVSHIWFVYNDVSTPTEGYVPSFAQVIFDVIDAYNARTSGYTSGVEYNFASAGARVEFCIGGHTHVDYDFRTNGGIPVILNETDSYQLRGDGKSAVEENEASVSVVVADYSKNVIHIIRAGRGEGRTVSISQ